jgi:hypothetical protein
METKLTMHSTPTGMALLKPTAHDSKTFTAARVGLFALAAGCGGFENS